MEVRTQGMDNRIAYSSLVRFLIQRQRVQVIDPGIEQSNFDAALCLSPTNCLEGEGKEKVAEVMCLGHLRLVPLAARERSFQTATPSCQNY